MFLCAKAFVILHVKPMAVALKIPSLLSAIGHLALAIQNFMRHIRWSCYDLPSMVGRRTNFPSTQHLCFHSSFRDGAGDTTGTLWPYTSSVVVSAIGRAERLCACNAFLHHK